jgi:hypothetical protein
MEGEVFGWLKLSSGGSQDGVQEASNLGFQENGGAVGHVRNLLRNSEKYRAIRKW